MICPECKAEYREGFETCSRCQIPLIDSPEIAEEPERVGIAGCIGIVLAVVFILAAFFVRLPGELPEYSRWIVIGLAIIFLIWTRAWKLNI